MKLKHNNPHYSDWLKSLTPEQYAKHKEERAVRKDTKRVIRSLAEDYGRLTNGDSTRYAILAGILNATLEQIKKANTGDTQAYVAVFDRHISKPTAQVDVTSNGQSVSMPTIIFNEDLPPDWKDDK